MLHLDINNQNIFHVHVVNHLDNNEGVVLFYLQRKLPLKSLKCYFFFNFSPYNINTCYSELFYFFG